MIQKIIKTYKKIKENIVKNKLMKSNKLLPIEKNLFLFIENNVSPDKQIILKSMFNNLKIISRNNSMHMDRETALNYLADLKKQDPDYYKNTEFKNNYEVFFIPNNQKSEKFNSLKNIDEFEWMKIKIIYSNNSTINLTISIVEQDSIYLDYDNEIMYEFEEGYLDLPYTFELVKINDF